MRVYVAGHRGMVGSAIVRELVRALPGVDILTRTRAELDLLNQSQVFEFLRAEKPDYTFIAAAKVGGIYANNTHRAEFIYENLAVQLNLIHGAHQAGLLNLMFLGSSCIYPRDCMHVVGFEGKLVFDSGRPWHLAGDCMTQPE